MQETIGNDYPAKRTQLRTALLGDAMRLTIVFVMALLASPIFADQTVGTPKVSPAKASKKGDSAKSGSPAKSGDSNADKSEKTAYDYNLPGPDGKDLPVSVYKDKFIVIVNLARKSSYNSQLPALIKLNDMYKDKALIVVGIPSNDFGTAEPGTPAEIKKAYAEAKVDFPIMAVSKVSGDDALPIATFLTKSKGAPAGGPIHWNYTKFIIDKKGAVIARLSPDVAPNSPEFLSTIEQILAGTYKQAKKGGDKPGEGGDDDDE